MYRPEERNGKADTLCRQLDPELEGESKSTYIEMVMFRPGQLELNPGEEVLTKQSIMTVAASQVEESKWIKQILDAGRKDSRWKQIKETLRSGKECEKDYALEDEMVTYRRRIYILDDNGLKLRVAQECHDTKVVEHFSRDKTYELVKRNYC